MSHVCCARTTGDILVVSDNGYGSRLALYTVNARPVGAAVELDIRVCSVAVSTRPEGTAVNCAAVATANGVIRCVHPCTILTAHLFACRLFELWTLSQIRHFAHDSFLEPIIRQVNAMRVTTT